MRPIGLQYDPHRIQSTTSILPLRRLILGVWESSLHTQDQLFLMVPPEEKRQLIFVAVYPPREHSSPNIDQEAFIKNLSEVTWNWQKNKKLQLKLGERNPFC